MQGLANPKTLEDLTGLTQLHLESEEALALEGSDAGSESGQPGGRGGHDDGDADDDWHEL